MAGLNLYKNYNLTLSDIHRQNQLIIQKSMSSAQQVAKPASKKYKVLSLGLLVIASIVGYLTWDKHMKMQKEVAEVKKTEVVILPPTIDKTDGYEPLINLKFVGSRNTSGSYIAGATLDKDNQNTPSVISKHSTIKLNKKTSLKSSSGVSKETNVPMNEQSISTDKAVKNRKLNQASSVLPVASGKSFSDVSKAEDSRLLSANISYTVDLDNINQTELNILKSTALKYQTDLSIRASTAETNYVWSVYKVMSGSGLFVEGLEVVPLKEFNNKLDAIAFAENLSYDHVLVKLTEKLDLRYDVRVCCMDFEGAKAYAQSSGITDRVFQLREKR